MSQEALTSGLSRSASQNNGQSPKSDESGVEFPLLRTLTVKHFRSLYNVQLALKPLNIIIGPNASGKSNLFKALRYLQNVVVEQKWEPYDNLRNHLLWYGQPDQPTEFTIELAVELPTDGILEQKGTCALNYNLSTSVASGRPSILSERLKLKLSPAAEEVEFIQRKQQGGSRYVYENTAQEGEKYVKRQIHELSDRLSALKAYTLTLEDRFPPVTGLFDFIKGWRFFDIQASAARASVPSSEEPYAIPLLASDGSNLSAFLYALSRYDEATFEEIQERLEWAIDLPEKVETTYVPSLAGAGEIRLSFQERPFPNVAIPAESISSGTIRLLAHLALLLGDPSASLILIEEPDHGLYPYLMLQLADTLRSIVDVSPYDEDDELHRPQIIITTHNTDFLDCFDLVAEANYLQVFTAERSSDDGQTILTPVDAKELSLWLNKYRLGELVRMGIMR